MRDGDGRQADGLHGAVGRREVPERREQRGGGVVGEPAVGDALVDEALEQERQLERQAETAVLEALEAGGQEVVVLGLVGGLAVRRDARAGRQGDAPLGAEVVLGRVEVGDEEVERLRDARAVVDLLGRGQGGGVDGWDADEDGAGQEADGRGAGV